LLPKTATAIEFLNLPHKNAKRWKKEKGSRVRLLSVGHEKIRARYQNPVHARVLFSTP
jgi:hypothetical protein